MNLYFDDRQALEQAHEILNEADEHGVVDVSYLLGDATAVYASSKKFSKDYRIEVFINSNLHFLIKFSRKEALDIFFYFLDIEVVNHGKKFVFDGTTTTSVEMAGMNLALISLLTNIEDFVGSPFPHEMWDHYDNFIKSRYML